MITLVSVMAPKWTTDCFMLYGVSTSTSATRPLFGANTPIAILSITATTTQPAT
jgi:hypothetical protein